MTPWRITLSLAALIGAVAAQPASGLAQSVALVVSPLVDHPVSLPFQERSSGRWRQQSGAWGEALSGELLRLRGFDEVYEIKTTRNQGIDRLAVKRAPDGAVADARIVETKVHRGSRLRLGSTRHGRQMSRKWMADRIRAMRRSPNEQVRLLAREIYRFSRSTGQPLTALGKIHEINTRTGRFTTRTADGLRELSSGTLDRHLRQIQERASSPLTRKWAATQRVLANQIRAVSESSWLMESRLSGPRLTATSANSESLHIASAAGARSALLRRSIARGAGPLAAVAALAVDARTVYEAESAYRTGLLSRRERNIAHLTVLGGAVGAWAGATGGGLAGAWIGGFGGPAAPITVPAGVLIGGAVGGLGGYFGGSSVAGFVASEWYSHLDARVRDQAERQILAAPLILK